jgi:hypothetical protein
MATRAIVTSPPVVACDVCGRRLLRGETPDVFLAGGQRRTVCELCVPRAAGEGWLRERDARELSPRPARPRRAGSLFGRLRQLREPQQRPARRASSRRQVAVESEGLYEDDVYELIDGAEGSDGERRGADEQAAVSIGSPAAGQIAPASARRVAGRSSVLLPDERSGGELAIELALRVFNEGETPLRVAGVARSLGAPTVVVRPVEGSQQSRVAIVVAWELCWYRYEVDLDDRLAGAQLVAEGMELEELPAEDQVANALADERGELALAAA